MGHETHLVSDGGRRGECADDDDGPGEDCEGPGADEVPRRRPVEPRLTGAGGRLRVQGRRPARLLTRPFAPEYLEGIGCPGRSGGPALRGRLLLVVPRRVAPFQLADVEGELERDPDPERLSLLVGLLDVKDVGADLNLVADGERLRLVEGNRPPVQRRRARSAEVDEVEASLYLADAGVEARDGRVVEPEAGVRQPADSQPLADDGLVLFDPALARDDEGARLYRAHLIDPGS